MLGNRAADEDLDAEGRANIEIRLKLVMAHARVLGMIVEKKQVAKATVCLDGLDRHELRTHLADMLDQLELAHGRKCSARSMIGLHAAEPSAVYRPSLRDIHESYSSASE